MSTTIVTSIRTAVVGALLLVMGTAVAAAAFTPMDNDWFFSSAYADRDGTLQVHSLLINVDLNHTDRAAVSIGQADYRSAIADLAYTLARFPNHPRALMLLTAVSKLTDRPALPLVYFERALRLYPQYALTHAQYGGYLVQINRTEEGIAKLNTATEIDRNLVIAYVWLAEAYAKTGKPELAQKAAARARELGYQRPPQEPASTPDSSATSTSSSSR